jgi:nitrogen fixation protein NifB
MLERVARHPCYSEEAHGKFGRIHVPVAPRCNISCNYCVREFACANENRPGVTTRVVGVDEALATVRDAVRRDPRLTVLGVAGPGDALANKATFELFERAAVAFPDLTFCLSTNGLLLLDRIDDVERLGIHTVTVTVNAVDPDVGEQIYAHVRYRGRTYRGREGFELLSRNQLEGLRQAARRGIAVKVNTVLIPGVNDEHLPEIARLVRALGAMTLNVIPMIPLGVFAALSEPTPDQLSAAQDACESSIDQFRGCTRCRADAIGVPGEEACALLAGAGSKE